MLLQIQNRRLCGGKEVLRLCRKPHLMYLIHIVLHGLRRIVRNKNIPPAAVADVIQHLLRPVKDGIFLINSSIHIEQEQSLVLQRPCVFSKIICAVCRILHLCPSVTF